MVSVQRFHARDGCVRDFPGRRSGHLAPNALELLHLEGRLLRRRSLLALVPDLLLAFYARGSIFSIFPCPSPSMRVDMYA